MAGLWVKFSYEDFFASTVGMEPETQARYLLMIMHMYQMREGTFEPERMRKRIGLTPKRWREFVDELHREGSIVVEANGFITQRRVAKEIHDLEAFRESQSRAGQASARARSVAAQDQAIENGVETGKILRFSAGGSNQNEPTLFNEINDPTPTTVPTPVQPFKKEDIRKQNTPPTPPGGKYSPEFLAFWKTCIAAEKWTGRKFGKLPTSRKFEKALRHATPQIIQATWDAYLSERRDMPERDWRFLKGPEVWLGSIDWQDPEQYVDPSTAPAPRAGSGPALDPPALMLRAWVANPKAPWPEALGPLETLPRTVLEVAARCLDPMRSIERQEAVRGALDAR